jgi:hydroxymethylglutaryl-CoA reductase
MSEGSRIPGFYNLPLEERLAVLSSAGGLNVQDITVFSGTGGLSLDQADHMIENVVSLHALPLGIGLNFLVNGKEVLVPMAIEEPSVVAGASFMAKLARTGGGFVAHSSPPEMIGQVQIMNVPDIQEACLLILENKESLLGVLAGIDPVLEGLGGGARDLEVYLIDESPVGPFLIVHLIYDVRDAMGANAVNTAAERLAPSLEAITGGRAHLRILSNLADRRLTQSSCMIPLNKLAFGDYSAEEVRDGIIAAWAFAVVDPYRAATHNKGIMNGVDAVVVATGNDWRAVEAGAHAYAARSGRYTSLSEWGVDDDGNLVGKLEMPMAVGIVGGATRAHPTSRAALKLMGVESANQLAEVIVSVGLAQNLAALRALATEGIQRGHMSLHARQVAISAGAEGEMIERLAAQLVVENTVRIDRAKEILEELMGGH